MNWNEIDVKYSNVMLIKQSDSVESFQSRFIQDKTFKPGRITNKKINRRSKFENVPSNGWPNDNLLLFEHLYETSEIVDGYLGTFRDLPFHALYSSCSLSEEYGLEKIN